MSAAAQTCSPARARDARRLAVRALALVALALGLAAGAAPAAQALTPSEKIVRYARAELAKGVREVPDGSNRGARIRMYGLSTTARYYPAPWCAYFVSYLAKKAGVPIGPGGTGLGYVPYIRSWAQRTGKWTQKPRPGYLITFPQHVGIVETVSANGTLTTIEGNAGNAVRRKYRRWKEATGYVRLAAGGKLTAPGRMPKARDKVKQALTARITAYPGFNVAVGQQVDFTSNDSAGAIARSVWDLGSGKYTKRGDNVSRRFTTPGRYTVRLKISDRKGRSAKTSAVVTVRSNIAPVAKLSVGPAAQVLVDTTVKASAGGSGDADGRIVRWSWLMPGDGQWRDGGAERSIKLTTPGDYSIGLRVYDNDGNVTETSAPVRVVDHPAPVVSAVCSTPRLATGARLSCRADTSASPVSISRVEWDMNDDGAFEATGWSTGWTYERPGAYAIRVRATDRRGRVAFATTQVEVTNRAPAARLAGASSMALGATIALDATGSTDPDGQVAGFAWDLDGDGQPDAAPAPAGRVTYTPAAPGSQTVRVWVTDELGAVTTAQLTVKVSNKAPTARIVLPSRVVVGTVITLDASSSSDPDGTIARYDWDINGDGTYTDASGPTVPMTYTKTGTTIVRVKVTDAFGLTDTESRTFTVHAS